MEEVARARARINSHPGDHDRAVSLPHAAVIHVLQRANRGRHPAVARLRLVVAGAGQVPVLSQRLDAVGGTQYVDDATCRAVHVQLICRLVVTVADDFVLDVICKQMYLCYIGTSHSG